MREGPDAVSVYRDAYIYGFPMVDSYRIQHSYFVDEAHPEYKGAWNQPHSVARVYTPEDKALQTPNSDTPYTFLGADLRAEPLVLSVPKVAAERYYSLQFIDMYTHNFAYVGSRTTGNGAGDFLLAGPDWNGAVPDGIKGVLKSETQFAFVLYRTQLFDAGDLDEVRRIQAGYRVQPLSSWLGEPPRRAPPVSFPVPLGAEVEKTSPQFFALLNFLLQFAPTHPSETGIRARFAAAGIGAGLPFDVTRLSAAERVPVELGMADAWRTFEQFKVEQIDTGKKTSADGFGSREFLHNDYLSRMSSAVLGIYGNSKEEANYPAYFVDSEGRPLDAASNRYTVTFPAGRLPPVHAFWSLTMYALPSSLLVSNAIGRSLINSSMESSLVRDADGGVTLYVQHESPGPHDEANWLPAPAGPFFMILREYWPRSEALDGRWKAPPARRVALPDTAAQPPANASGSRSPKGTMGASSSKTGATGPAAGAFHMRDPGDPRHWRRLPDGRILVTPDNFIRAESNLYMAGQAKDGAFGGFKHTREIAPVDKQLIVRLNRDTIYSSGLFDLDAGPVTLTLPDSRGRFMSALIINEDHFNPDVFYGAGTHTLTRETVGSRYALVAIRILADPDDPEDLAAAHSVQDALMVRQPGGPGVFEIPPWDPVSQKKVREALIALSETLPDLRHAAGRDLTEVDPVRRIAAAASGWGLNPDRDAIYLNVVPEQNDGRVPHVLSVGEVPVDAFWSVTVYTREGFFQPNPLNAYSINSVTGKRRPDGTVTIRFGGCGVGSENCLPITPGWNYMVRLYRPRPELLDGRWSFPVARPGS